MEILIIGGTGNISADVADLLHTRGHKVTLVTTGRKPVPEKFQSITADRFDKASFPQAVSCWNGDTVINFLGFTPEECRLDYEAFRGKINQYVFISSATVYKKPHTTLPVTEDMALGNEFSEYARNKIACEEYLKSVQDEDFPVTVIRPSHTFGKTWIPSPLNGTDWTVSARILKGEPILIHDSGQSLWTLTAASDFAAGLAGLVGQEKALGETFHITHDQVLTWNAIYYELGLALGKQPDVVHIPSDFLAAEYSEAGPKLIGDKAEHGVFDNTKIKRFVPEFECVKSFRQAIREAVEWYRAVPERQKVNEEQNRLINELIRKWRSQ